MASCIKLEDISGFEYIEAEYVYDIEVENDHNYYIYSGKEFLVHNSSKTYSIAQLFVGWGYKFKNKRFSIVRKNMPSLRATAMRDFFTILKENDLYDEAFHNKSDNIYKIRSNEFEFFGLDEPQKVRSRRRDYLWLNEGNEMSLESFRQLNMRTNERVFIDFNPSDEFHWIYDDVITRPDCELIKSSYLDNPFLPDQVVKEIERYKDIDENYWNIYGLGERGVSSTRIYSNFELIDKMPEGETLYGLDFGFNHPTSLCRVVLKDDDIYTEQIIYESYLTNSKLIQKMNELQVNKDIYIYADSEDPNRIEEIKKAGFNIKPANKNQGSVKMGIDMIKRRKVYLMKTSIDALKEMRSYSWKTKGELVLDEPVKINDDFCFSGDTIVNGKRIDEIGVCTGYKEVFEYSFAGLKIKATKDHPVLTQRGFVGIDTLRYNDLICVKQSFMTVSGGQDTQMLKKGLIGLISSALARLMQAKERDYIDMFGEKPTGKYLRATTYTILIVTPLIIALITWLALVTMTTLAVIVRRNIGIFLGKMLRKQLRKLRSGLKQMRVKKEEQKLVKQTQSTSLGIRLREIAIFVIKGILQKQLFHAGVIQTANKRRYVGLKKVWGLKTKNGMYQANGLLVKNCDSLRYPIFSHFFGREEAPRQVISMGRYRKITAGI